MAILRSEFVENVQNIEKKTAKLHFHNFSKILYFFTFFAWNSLFRPRHEGWLCFLAQKMINFVNFHQKINFSTFWHFLCQNFFVLKNYSENFLIIFFTVPQPQHRGKSDQNYRFPIFFTKSSN